MVHRNTVNATLAGLARVPWRKPGDKDALPAVGFPLAFPAPPKKISNEKADWPDC